MIFFRFWAWYGISLLCHLSHPTFQNAWFASTKGSLSAKLFSACKIMSIIDHTFSVIMEIVCQLIQFKCKLSLFVGLNVYSKLSLLSYSLPPIPIPFFLLCLSLFHLSEFWRQITFITSTLELFSFSTIISSSFPQRASPTYQSSIINFSSYKDLDSYLLCYENTKQFGTDRLVRTFQSISF